MNAEIVFGKLRLFEFGDAVKALTALGFANEDSAIEFEHWNGQAYHKMTGELKCGMIVYYTKSIIVSTNEDKSVAAIWACHRTSATNSIGFKFIIRKKQ